MRARWRHKNTFQCLHKNKEDISQYRAQTGLCCHCVAFCDINSHQEVAAIPEKQMSDVTKSKKKKKTDPINIMKVSVVTWTLISEIAAVLLRCTVFFVKKPFQQMKLLCRCLTGLLYPLGCAFYLYRVHQHPQKMF